MAVFDMKKLIFEYTHYTEMAKEMLELFYGPELEGIWASYQPDPDVVRRGPLEEEEDTLEHMEYE